jgi:hypothetical protein
MSKERKTTGLIIAALLFVGVMLGVSMGRRVERAELDRSENLAADTVSRAEFQQIQGIVSDLDQRFHDYTVPPPAAPPAPLDLSAKFYVSDDGMSILSDHGHEIRLEKLTDRIGRKVDVMTSIMARVEKPVFPSAHHRAKPRQTDVPQPNVATIREGEPQRPLSKHTRKFFYKVLCEEIPPGLEDKVLDLVDAGEAAYRPAPFPNGCYMLPFKFIDDHWREILEEAEKLRKELTPEQLKQLDEATIEVNTPQA